MSGTCASEPRLCNPDVHALGPELGGVGLAQPVGMNPLLDPGLLAQPVQQPPDVRGQDRPAPGGARGDRCRAGLRSARLCSGRGMDIDSHCRWYESWGQVTTRHAAVTDWCTPNPTVSIRSSFPLGPGTMPVHRQHPRGSLHSFRSLHTETGSTAAKRLIAREGDRGPASEAPRVRYHTCPAKCYRFSCCSSCLSAPCMPR